MPAERHSLYSEVNNSAFKSILCLDNYLLFQFYVFTVKGQRCHSFTFIMRAGTLKSSWVERSSIPWRRHLGTRGDTLVRLIPIAGRWD